MTRKDIIHEVMIWTVLGAGVLMVVSVIVAVAMLVMLEGV